MHAVSSSTIIQKDSKWTYNFQPTRRKIMKNNYSNRKQASLKKEQRVNGRSQVNR